MPIQYKRNEHGYYVIEHTEGSEEEEYQEEQQTVERSLRRVGKAQSPRVDNTPIGMARCPECGALIPKSRLVEHIETRHQDQDEDPLDNCPFCAAEVRASRLEKHIQKVHPEKHI